MAKIKIDKELLNRAQKISQVVGYSSVEEYITHLLEKELDKFESSDSSQLVEERLRGLGYIG